MPECPGAKKDKDTHTHTPQLWKWDSLFAKEAFLQRFLFLCTKVRDENTSEKLPFKIDHL